MLTGQVILNVLSVNLKEWEERYGVSKLALFGSYAKGRRQKTFQVPSKKKIHKLSGEKWLV